MGDQLSLSQSPEKPIYRTPACSTTEQAGSFFVYPRYYRAFCSVHCAAYHAAQFFVCCIRNNRALAAKNCIRTRLCRFFFVLRRLIDGIWCPVLTLSVREFHFSISQYLLYRAPHCLLKNQLYLKKYKNSCSFSCVFEKNVVPLQRFSQYLHAGYFPFFQEDHYNPRLQGIIKQTIEVDIPVFPVCCIL